MRRINDALCALTVAGVMAGGAMAEEPAGPSLTRPAEGLSNMMLGERSIDYFTARPAGDGTWPGIVLLHDGWGMRDQVKAIARRLADEGFVVYAPDLNKGKIAKSAEKAREIAILMDKADAASVATELGGWMKQQSFTGDHRVGIVGIDTGGSLALRATMETSDFAAAVTIYGKPVTDADELRRIGPPLLGIYGGADASIPQDQVARFRTALEDGNHISEIKSYEGLGHGFMDEESKSYDRGAAADAWSLVVSFLRTHL